MYQVNTRSCSVLTKVAFLMLSSVMPWASYTDFITNQNGPGSSFPTPLNIDSCTVLAIPIFGGGGGGVGVSVDGFEAGEEGGGMDGGCISGKRSLINQSALLGENFTSSSSFSYEIEIKALFFASHVPW